MQKFKLMSILILLLGISASAQDDSKGIKKCITAFADAGDRNDAASLDKHLDANYRVVLNRLFGSNEITVMSRSLYLEKIKTKEFGGDKRSLTFKEIVTNGSTATAKVEFKGRKMTVTSLLTLVRDHQGSWKLISDVPMTT